MAEARRAKGGPNPVVAIRFEAPERTPYADLVRAVQACGAVDFEKLDVAGVPLSLPPSACNWRPPDKFWPAFDPIEVRSIEDLDALQGLPDLFRGRGILLKPGEDTPADLVLTAMRKVHEAGGTIALALPYDKVETDGPGLVTLSHRPLALTGEIEPILVRPFRAGPYRGPLTSDSSPRHGDYAVDRLHVVYVVDTSGSMTFKMDNVKYELKRDILCDLQDLDEFHVISFSSGPPDEMPTRRLVNATERYKSAAIDFIDSIVCHGQADPSAALDRAFACRPDIIYILTDDDFDAAAAELIHCLNAGKKVAVSIVSFADRPDSDSLKKIARDNGGTYELVAEDP